MNTLFETEDGISSEDEDDFNDELSWYESEPEMEALSDSNSEIDGSDTEYEDEDDSVGQEVRGKDGYLWKTEPTNARRTPRRNIVTSTPGPKCVGLAADTPLKSFELFFDDSMLSEIVTRTNQKIEKAREAYTIRSGFTYNTDATEVRGLIGVLLFLGVTKSSKESTASIWSTDGTGKPICIAAMSQKRFLFLLYCLRFDNSTTRDQRRGIDKLAPIRSVYDIFVTACEDNYTPGIGCTVDESLLGFRGRCAFKQYIPNKPSKYGIKVYVLADSESFYSVSSKIYVGAGTHTPRSELPVPTQAVLDLITIISGTNRNITTDNYYTSIPLANELKSRQLTLVGTMKKNKRCIPPSFLTKTDAGTCQYAFDHANNFTLLSIAPKKNKRVVFLSTMHATRSHDSVSGKEEINAFYNHEKGSVNSHDQMCAQYTTARKTNRWPMRVFYGIVDSSAQNAYVIFTHNTLGFGGNKTNKRQKFFKKIIQIIDNSSS